MSLNHQLYTFGIEKRLTITQETQKKKEKSKQIQRRKHTHNKENKRGDGADRPEKTGQSGESKLNFNESSVCCYRRKINHYPAQNKKPEEYHTRSGWQPDEKVRTCIDKCHSSDQSGPLVR